MFSAKGYYTIIPKLLDPTMDGREGGDGEKTMNEDDFHTIQPKNHYFFVDAVEI